MERELTELEARIEDLRWSLMRLADLKGRSHHEVIAASTRLDAELNRYHRLKQERQAPGAGRRIDNYGTTPAQAQA